VPTPFTAATVFVPESVPPPGFWPIAIVIDPLKLVAVLPYASRAVTWTAGEIEVLVCVVLGCTVKSNALALAAETLNDALVAPVSPLAAAVSV
jgi:hypothetical protein